MSASGPSTPSEDQIAERGARMARRDDGEYRQYLTKEQRSQPGCPAREVVLDRRGRATKRPGLPFTPRERRLIARLHTPDAVQRFLNRLPYNQEPHGRATLRSFRGVVRAGCAHCLEAALFAAVVLEQHGYPPLVLSFESIDALDHVLFVYRSRSGWGSIARSRDPGLHGRKAVFATPRALALSYFDPYVDYSGRVIGYAIVDLAGEMGAYDWRLAETNVWKVERMLLDYPHRTIRSSDARVTRLRERYRKYRATYGRKPVYYKGRERWTPLPAEFVEFSRDRNRAPVW